MAVIELNVSLFSSLSCSQFLSTVLICLTAGDVTSATMSCWKSSIASTYWPLILVSVLLSSLILMFNIRDMVLPSTYDQISNIVLWFHPKLFSWCFHPRVELLCRRHTTLLWTFSIYRLIFYSFIIYIDLETHIFQHFYIKVLP